jgi:hypothetical protein
MVEMGWKVADGHLVPLFYIRKGNNCFRRIGNEEIFTTQIPSFCPSHISLHLTSVAATPFTLAAGT